MATTPASQSEPLVTPDLAPGDEAASGTQGTGEGICPRCGGSGRIASNACPECGGSGKVVIGIGGG